LCYFLRGIGNQNQDNKHSGTASESGIEAVGPTKPLGHYPIPEETGEEARKKLIDKYEKRGLKTYLFDSTGRGLYYLLYVFDEESLQELLSRRKKILLEKLWPLKAPDFVRMVAIDQVPSKTKLYTVIAEAFNDENNPGRIDVK